jgi:ribosomal protein L37E
MEAAMRIQWILHSCPRCGGDILVEQDYDGWTKTCLQCGYRSYLVQNNQSAIEKAEKRTMQF